MSPSLDLEVLFAMASDMLCIASLEGYFLRVNPAFTRVLGLSAEELLSRPFFDFVHPDDRNATLTEMDHLASGQVTYRFENRYRCADGTYRWLAWTSTPHDGLLYAIARDVTEEKRAAAEMTEMRAQSAWLDGFLETVRTFQHEINNPLQALLGTLELVNRAESRGDSRELSVRLARIHDAAERIAKVVENLTRVADPKTVDSPMGRMIQLTDDVRAPNITGVGGGGNR